MAIERDEARQHLEIIGHAQRRAVRHSINNGVVLILWGGLIALGLSLFDHFSGPVATGLWGALAVVGTVITARYGARLPVRARRWGGPMFWTMLVVMAIYYPILLLGGIALFPQRTPWLFTAVGLLTALPLVVVGALLWRRSGER